MGQVASINTNVKSTVDDVCNWLEAKAERGELPASTARLKCTALRQLLTPQSEDEPKEVEWVLGHIDDLTRRWATLNSKYKSDTAVTYASRVRSALEDYLRWQNDPTSFRFRESRARVDKADRTEAADRKPRKPVESGEDLGSAVASNCIASTFRLGAGREFAFSMPDDVSVRDVRRIATHLLTYAHDWEPMAPNDSLAITRAEQE